MNMGPKYDNQEQSIRQWQSIKDFLTYRQNEVEYNIESFESEHKRWCLELLDAEQEIEKINNHLFELKQVKEYLDHSIALHGHH